MTKYERIQKLIEKIINEDDYSDGYADGYRDGCKTNDYVGVTSIYNLFCEIEKQSGDDVAAMMDAIKYKKFVDKLKINIQPIKEMLESEIVKTAAQCDIDLDKMFEKYGKDN